MLKLSTQVYRVFNKFFWRILLASLLFLVILSRTGLAQQEEQTKQAPENKAPESTAAPNEATEDNTTEKDQGSTNGQQPNVVRPKLPPLEDSSTLSLQAQLPASEVLMLPRLDGEQLFLSAYLSENTGSPKGGVLLIPAEGQHINWPASILPLRKKLPDAGWHTLAIMPIYFSSKAIPERTFFPKGIITLATRQPATTSQEESPDTQKSEAEKEGNTEKESSAEKESDTKESGDKAEKQASNTEGQSTDKSDEKNKEKQEITETNSATEKQESPEASDAAEPYNPIEDMFNRINQGLSHLAKQGLLFQVLIAQGEGAHWVLAYLKEQEPENVHALILINPVQSKVLTTKITPLLEKSSLLTLDIYTTQYPGPSPEASARIAAAHRNKNYNYFQYRLPAAPGSLETTNNWLFKRVKSWLKRRTKTTEVTTKKIK